MIFNQLEEIYNALLNRFLDQNWWPATTKDEIIIGAILTQSVNWSNVEKAIANLKQNSLCTLSALHDTKAEIIAPLIRSSLYFNQKTKKLKHFTNFLFTHFEGNLKLMFRQNLEELREDLLKIHGIGEETADSILLYAGDYPIFVIDAYTIRICQRLGCAQSKWKYAKYQKFFMDHLSADVAMYKDFHAQLVNLGKNICKKKHPECKQCPLSKFCEYYENTTNPS